MGQKVGKFIVEVGKAAAKGATSFVLGKVPVLGPIVANKLNSLYAKGGKVIALAEGGEVPPGMKKLVINTPAQLLALVKKEPEIASKVGLTVEEVKEGIQMAKEGEAVVAKRRGGRAKKAKASKAPKEDRVMLESGSAPAFARGGLVPSVF
jgi:hypothetical protein